MNIQSILNDFDKQLDEWVDTHKESEKPYLSDPLSHAKEFLLNSDEYKDDATANDINSRLSKFIDLSNHYPGVAKDARLYICNHIKEMIESAKVIPLKKDIDNILLSVNEYIENNVPNEYKKDYLQAQTKLEKLLGLIKGLKQRNVNLPDMLLSQYKYQSLSLDTKQISIFDNIYRIANDAMSRDQIKGHDQAFQKAHRACIEFFEHKEGSTDYKIGINRTLLQLMNFKGNNINMLIKIKTRELTRISSTSDNDSEIDRAKGEKDALNLFTEKYDSPKRKKILEREDVSSTC